MDPVQCCTHPTDLFRLIGNPIVFSMNVDLELYSSSPTLYPTPLHPFNTDEILLIPYTRRWVYLFPQNRKRGRRKKKKKTRKNYPSLLFGLSSQVQVQHSVRAMQYAGVCGDAPAVLFSEKFVSTLTSHHKCAATFSDKCNWIRWKPSAVQNGKNSNPVNSLTEQKKI